MVGPRRVSCKLSRIANSTVSASAFLFRDDELLAILTCAEALPDEVEGLALKAEVEKCIYGLCGRAVDKVEGGGVG